MVSNKKLANAVGGKSARACDGCIRKRARWYCAADDAFLCQSCDSSVHSANPLARRHKRVRLKTASLKTTDGSPLENFVPTWQRGFTKKARTPRRHGKKYAVATNHYQLPLVPEMMPEDTNSFDGNEEQLLYRVPIFDPLVAELCSSANSNEEAAAAEMSKAEFGGAVGGGGGELHAFLPSQMDLAEFAADVESLLGNGLEEESFDMEDLGLLDCKQKDDKDSVMEGSLGSERIVKIEDHYDNDDRNEGKPVISDQEQHLDTFELSFDYDESPAFCEGEGDKVRAKEAAVKEEEEEEEGMRNKNNKRLILLRLDYEAVLKAWADQRSPWTAGGRPELNGIDCWPDCMGSCGMVHHPYGDIGVIGGNGIVADGGRKARVSRYREKRRTRLFSKKIRYEVRKLNAEKRPRMKGRFVKRANFTAGGPVAAFSIA